MKTASIRDIKKALSDLPEEKVLEIALRLVKYKKENKELLNFLLFYAEDLNDYSTDVRFEVDELFTGIEALNPYKGMKLLRKILRLLNRYIKYSGDKRVEIELRIHYLKKLRSLHRRITNSTAFTNLYEGQLKKIDAAIEKLHEDYRKDYTAERQALDVPE